MDIPFRLYLLARRMRPRLLAVVLCAAALAGPAPASAEPYVIGQGLGLSGPLAPMAADQRDGLRLWADEINASGGLDGRPVELDIRDHGDDPARAVAVYEALAAPGKADWLLAPLDSDLIRAVRPVAARQGRVLLASADAAEEPGSPGPGLIVNVTVPPDRQTLDFLTLLVLSGLSDLALAAPDGTYARQVLDGAGTWAGRFGLRVVLTEQGVAPDGWPGVVRRARSAGARVLLVCGRMDEAVAARRAMDEEHWPGILFATVGPAMDEFGLRLGPLAEGVFSTAAWEYDLGRPDVRRFERAFLQRFGRRPSYHAAAAYSAGQVLAAAALRADSLDPDKMASAMARLDMMTVAGRFDVGDDGRQLRQFAVVVQWRDGLCRVVWPPALAQLPPMIRN